jgi:D-glycero-alpha-D-manno-heptose-7-phosphate kinase
VIISKTPFRISFVGGGTDLSVFYKKEPGRVISTSINRYMYVLVKRQTCIVEYKYRINWSSPEFCNSIDEIQHPIVRESLKMLNINFPIEISTFSDIPAQTGLGSSSAFAVGLLNALCKLIGKKVDKHSLAEMAYKVEVGMVGRSMGSQDHFSCSYGGMNVIDFHSDGRVDVTPASCTKNEREILETKIILFYTNIKRNASKILKVQESETLKKFNTLKKMKELVRPLEESIPIGDDRFGRILHENWMLKKEVSKLISSDQIDSYYKLAIDSGAIGGKLLGAGLGGFLMFFVNAKDKQSVIEAMDGLYCLDIEFEENGTRIVYNEADLL